MKNILKTILPLAAGMSIGLTTGTAAAQDIELFLTPTTEGDLPNLMIMIDNSANWNASIGDTTKKEMEHRALYEVLTSCEMRGGTVDEATGDCVEGDTIVNLGVMTFANGNSPRGGKVISAVAPLDSVRQQEIAELLYAGGDPSASEQIPGTNNAPYAMMLNEAYRYFAGLTPASGTQDGDHDTAAIDTDGTYLSPATACGKNYAILVGNGQPDSGENRTAESTLRGLGGVLPTDPLKVTPNDFEANWADEYARFLSETDISTALDGTQSLLSYVVDVHEHLAPDPGATDPHHNDPDYNKGKFKGARAWLRNISRQGNGQYFSASSTTEVRDALTTIIDELVAKNSVYASTTLPVSVNVRGTHLNQVYMGVFRPDESARTRWLGNLKMYHLAVDYSNDTLYLADVNGDPVEDASNGFIISSAESFWSKDSSFWAFDPRGVPPSASDLPDGAVVEKGGAAQHLRESFASGRTVYTCDGCTSGLQAFNSTNVSTTDLGAASDAERDSIIAWVRGTDVEDEDGDGFTTDARASIHGDVLHSRPAVVNYNRYTNADGSVNDNDIVAFYGANDGIFHAVKGGKGPTPPDGTGYEAGDELWGLIPGEFLGKLKNLYDNVQGIPNKQYFMDGGIGVYQYDANSDGKLVATDGDKVYLYVGMRRGGRLLYALDVSDPATPSLLWKRSEADWAELGQSWSLPQVVTIADANGNPKPILVFGLGYDPAAEDAYDGLTVWPNGKPTIGRGIAVVDALTGNLIWQTGPGAGADVTVADMTYGVPSDVTVIDLNGDRIADKLYVGDTGGQIWRVDIGDSASANWTVHKFAALAGTGLAGQRKFLYAPDVVWNKDDGYLAILIGSGDREKPQAYEAENRFYMLKDTNTNRTIAAQGTVTAITEADLYDATNNDIQDGTDAERDAAQTALDTAQGWYIKLDYGEKVVSNAVSLDGTTVFNTHLPDPNPSQCEQLGIARVYQVSYEDASSTTENNGVAGLNKGDRFSTVAGGGYPPPPVPIVVEIDGRIFEGISVGPTTKPGSNVRYGSRERAYWYREYD